MIAFAGGLRLLDGPVTAALSSAALVVGAAALWWAWGRWLRKGGGRKPGPAQGGWGDIGIVPLEAFSRALQRAEARATARADGLCVMVVDLDSFAAVNDALGHTAADQVLGVTARRLAELMPQRLAMCRLGGDEFVMALACPLVQAQALARRVLETIRQPVTEGTKRPLSLRASVGIATWPPHGPHDHLLRQAQLAMRSVKETGGNGWAVFDPQMAVDERAQAALVAALRFAVSRRQLELYYQPKVDAQTLRITAAEALLRWHHPENGLISPDVFIPLAERHGLIGEIGNWVIGDACRQAGIWRQAGLRMRVAINLSAYQMRQDDLVDRLQQALAANQLQPSRFTVEITETLALENTRATQRTFERLRQAGLHVAIDDFGAGQTSLGSLKNLPASELKMDMSLVRDLATCEDTRKIADAVIRLSHALRKRVVAEGVETTTQRDLLLAMGCDELQGYLFARPMSAAALGLWAMDDRPASQAAFAQSLFQETRPPVSV